MIPTAQFTTCNHNRFTTESEMTHRSLSPCGLGCMVRDVVESADHQHQLVGDVVRDRLSGKVHRSLRYIDICRFVGSFKEFWVRLQVRATS